MLPGFGHTQSFFDDQPDAGTRLILTFLDSGRVDVSGYTPLKMDFTPPSTYGSLAKRLVGAMLALSTLMLVTLAVLARRRWTRERLGRTTELLTRSVGAVVLGLGGWSLGALAVLAAMPAVRVDNELVVVLTVGGPVGTGCPLGVGAPQLAPRMVRARLLVAGAGALVGAWVGFEATDVPISLVTSVVGAVAVANLALILLEMSRDRSLRQRAAVPSLDGGPRTQVPSSRVAG